MTPNNSTYNVTHGIDIENAFLESDLEETIYMKLPVDTDLEADGKPVIVRLKKSLYGLKQAGELFYKLMNRILTSKENGMKCCIHDICVFTLFDDETNERVIVVLWVDDIIITGNSISIVERIISHIEYNVTKMSNLGQMTRYIGIDMVRDRVNRTLELTQVPYIKSLINKQVLISRRLMSL